MGINRNGFQPVPTDATERPASAEMDADSKNCHSYIVNAKFISPDAQHKKASWISRLI
ncbi:hypothetical protein [uncultured Chryseobacterium sp.]|uniref:hypothetical protein n=1 Tax=uncultured Chryseobacterium sp. TaxID=259322 RepID=UPI0025D2ECF6|nr:hypothetical protein [uncultured Chryseobacterium sp.]